MIFAVSLFLTIPTLVLIDEIYSHVIPKLDDCCEAPIDNATKAVCVVQRGQLKTVFGKIFLGVLWVGFIFTVVCASIILHWRWVDYQKKGCALSPVLVAIFGTIAIFTLILSFGAATFIVELSTSGFYDCDPLSDQLLLQNAWLQCITTAIVTVLFILKIRSLYPNPYKNLHGPAPRTASTAKRVFTITDEEMDGSEDESGI